MDGVLVSSTTDWTTSLPHRLISQPIGATVIYNLTSCYCALCYYYWLDYCHYCYYCFVMSSMHLACLICASNCSIWLSGSDSSWRTELVERCRFPYSSMYLYLFHAVSANNSQILSVPLPRDLTEPLILLFVCVYLFVCNLFYSLLLSVCDGAVSQTLLLLNALATMTSEFIRIYLALQLRMRTWRELRIFHDTWCHLYGQIRFKTITLPIVFKATQCNLRFVLYSICMAIVFIILEHIDCAANSYAFFAFNCTCCARATRGRM